MEKHSSALIANLDKVHTTTLGTERIKRNLGIEHEDCVRCCVEKIKKAETITRKGKNWYARCGDCIITVNARSYTIIKGINTAGQSANLRFDAPAAYGGLPQQSANQRFCGV